VWNCWHRKHLMGTPTEMLHSTTTAVIRSALSGYDLLNNPRLNKGTAFTEKERDAFALHGLLPPHVGSLEEQMERRMKALRNQQTSFSQYSFMRDLQDTNETLFYALLAHDMEALLPVVYMPAVGEGCQRFSILVATAALWGS
jgi:malate dehydrogenase (oxaloacetate-decarboxylating)